MKTGFLQDTCAPHGYHSIIHNSQGMETAQRPSTDESTKDVTHNGILLSHEKGGYLPFETTWIDLEHIMLSEINQRKASIV